MNMPEDPSLTVITLALGDEVSQNASDLVIAQWLEQGHGDLLIEGLVDTIISLVEIICGTCGEPVDMEAMEQPHDWWASYCLRVASGADG